LGNNLHFAFNFMLPAITATAVVRSQGMTHALLQVYTNSSLLFSTLAAQRYSLFSVQLA
jgi:hypothetical protein